jgi:hypothetical protein
MIRTLYSVTAREITDLITLEVQHEAQEWKKRARHAYQERFRKSEEGLLTEVNKEARQEQLRRPAHG